MANQSLYPNIVSTTKTGKLIEEIAANFLLENGLLIIDRNFTSKIGEIDIIAKDIDTLVFVEIRYKREIYHGEPAATVNRTKQRKIINTAKLYLQKYDLYDKVDCRFDVIGITGEIELPEITWFKDAFWA